jgi:hypothetical protein
MAKKADLEQEYLDKARIKHKALYGCALGYKRCVKCTKVAAIEKFTSRSNWCKKCSAIRQVEYRLASAAVKLAELGDGERKKPGRPPGAKNKC